MVTWSEWWVRYGRPGRLPTSAPLSILLATLLTLISLLFLLNAKALKGNANPLLELPDNDLGVAQHHPELINYIKQLHLIKPQIDSKYNLIKPNVSDFSQNGQGLEVARIFGYKRNGLFIEAGAYNGEYLSNTLYFERELGWTGLLVEPDPWNFWSLRKKGRKAWSIQACLSTTPYPREVTFRQSNEMGRIVEDGTDKKGIYTRVKCFPIYSLILALNTTHIDFLSLDVEGAELEVLTTIPWDVVTFDVLCVEHAHIPEGGHVLATYLQEKGFTLYKSIGDDYIFVRNDLDIDLDKENVIP